MASASGWQRLPVPAALLPAALRRFSCWCCLPAACGDDAPPHAHAPATPVAAPDRAPADPARGMTTELDGAAPTFGDADARRAHRRRRRGARPASSACSPRSDAPPASPRARRSTSRRSRRAPASGATRSTWSRAPPRSRRATSRSPRASRSSQARHRRRSQGDVRGPPLGTPLPGVDARGRRGVRRRRARARRRSARSAPARRTSRRCRARSGFKEDATEDVVAQVPRGRRGRRARAGRGRLPRRQPLSRPRARPAVRAAAELDPGVAAGLRRTLRGALARLSAQGGRRVHARASRRPASPTRSCGGSRPRPICAARRMSSARPAKVTRDRLDRRRAGRAGARDDLGLRSRLPLRRRCVRGAAHVRRPRDRPRAPPRAPGRHRRRARARGAAARRARARGDRRGRHRPTTACGSC